jgi:hypothetical protein
MTYYFETAPLPTAWAWYAHQLPRALLHLLSWATLVIELVVPLLIFGPRRARTLAALVFTGFQLVNTLTANYGFFTYLSSALHLFLLDDEQLRPLARRLPPWLLSSGAHEPGQARTSEGLSTLGSGLQVLAAVGYLGLSTVGALASFAPRSLSDGLLVRSYAALAPFRLTNVYHLFGHITRERIEPVFEAEDDSGWHELELPYKPGDPRRAPGVVAPHQPRFDFRLWFYGLSAQAGAPEYVRNALTRLCHDPAAIQRLFASALPASARAVRIVFYQYHFSTPEVRAETGAWWTRSRLGELGPVTCATFP